MPAISTHADEPDTQWFVLLGPLTAAQLREHLADGHLDGALVKRAGESRWLPAAFEPGLVGTTTTTKATTTKATTTEATTTEATTTEATTMEATTMDVAPTKNTPSRRTATAETLAVSAGSTAARQQSVAQSMPEPKPEPVTPLSSTDAPSATATSVVNQISTLPQQERVSLVDADDVCVEDALSNFQSRRSPLLLLGALAVACALAFAFVAGRDAPSTPSRSAPAVNPARYTATSAMPAAADAGVQNTTAAIPTTLPAASTVAPTTLPATAVVASQRTPRQRRPRHRRRASRRKARRPLVKVAGLPEQETTVGDHVPALGPNAKKNRQVVLTGQVVRENRTALRACSLLVQRRGERVEPGTRVYFDVTVGNDGKAKQVKVVGRAPSALLSCYQLVARRWALPTAKEPYKLSFIYLAALR